LLDAFRQVYNEDHKQRVENKDLKNCILARKEANSKLRPRKVCLLEILEPLKRN
jgi:hypothetical protein